MTPFPLTQAKNRKLPEHKEKKGQTNNYSTNHQDAVLVSMYNTEYLYRSH